MPLEIVVAQTAAAIAKSIGLLRSRDAITPYMYLPPLPAVLDGERVACLSRPRVVSDEPLRTIDPNDLSLHERGEDDLTAESWPPSPDDPADMRA